MNDRIIVAADELTEQQTLALTSSVGSSCYAIKIHELYDCIGPSIIKELKDAGARRVWVDAKLHDIPNTVRARTRAYVAAGADIVSAHASGGVEMLKAAKEGAGKAEVYAITVLTSLSEEEAGSVFGRPLKEQVLALAKTAKAAGVDGIVCSPKEVGMLSNDPELRGIALIVPGVRSPGADTHDQKRVATPHDAIAAGAARIVVGRQITTAPDPVAALSAIEAELP